MTRAVAFALLALASSLILNGCKQIEMKNGQIPEAFVSEAKKTEGTYKGHIEINDGSGVEHGMRPLDLTLKIDGTHPVLTSSSDWLGDDCHSKIGDLQNVIISGGKVKYAAFAFDPGSCKQDGMSPILMVSLSKMANGKQMLFAWIQTGYSPAPPAEPGATPDPAGAVETVVTQGHFQQQ